MRSVLREYHLVAADYIKIQLKLSCVLSLQGDLLSAVWTSGKDNRNKEQSLQGGEPKTFHDISW